ncbi:unnamed protein product [Mytilus coruscus]|uniref:C-type lectin domain-containing protein n=1 Tax=Mytilus coruscus TaxID=42192 RepID=A0A6J8C6P8_MYTCO|nr:unnamed protein product [Mytilus coruscus]
MTVSILLEITAYSVLVLASTTLFTEPLTWNEANQYCISMGQYLVTIDRQGKQQLLHKALLDIFFLPITRDPDFDEIWIGLHAPHPLQPTYHVWTNKCVPIILILFGFPVPKYSNWLPGLNSDNDDLCTYMKLEDESMYWLLGECGTDARPFMCESDTAICNSGISYDTESNRKVTTGMSGYTKLDFGTEQDCKDFCDPLTLCWGFAFTPSVPKCVMYDVFDDPFRLEDNQISVMAEDLYIKRCYFELNEDTNVLIVPPYDNCGSTVISDCVLCVTTTEQTTTEYLTSTQVETTSVKVSTADKITETTLPVTTEPHMTSTVDVASSDLHTTTSQLDIISIPKSSIDQTIQKEFTTISEVKRPYCVCTCSNVTKQISLEESINEIVNEIKVDRSKTSSYTRKHTSAWDSRKSAASIGFVGIAILISIVSLLLCLDSASLINRVCVLLRKLGTSSNADNENGN